MASKKVSNLTATTSIGSQDLLLISQLSDGIYSSKQIEFSDLINGYASESYVNTAISNLVDGAPTALDTLNELAAALNDDSSAASTLTTLIDANETHIDNLATLTGMSKDSTDLGAFLGSTISDNNHIEGALQELETAVEGKQASATDLDNLSAMGTGASAALALLTQSEIEVLDGLSATQAELDILYGVTASTSDLNVLSGTSVTSTEFGYLAGVTSGVQSQLDAIPASGDNVNTFVGSTSADSVPTDSNGADNYFFVVVDKSDGAIKVIDKEFIEVE